MEKAALQYYMYSKSYRKWSIQHPITILIPTCILNAVIINSNIVVFKIIYLRKSTYAYISTVASYNLYNTKHVHIVFKTNEQQNKDLIYYTTRLHLTVLCTLNYYNLFHIIYVLTLPTYYFYILWIDKPPQMIGNAPLVCFRSYSSFTPSSNLLALNFGVENRYVN